MAISTLRDELLTAFDQLSPDKQARVVAFTRSLGASLPPGIPGEVLLQLAQEISFDSKDLAGW
jgi:hypothetical protein